MKLTILGCNGALPAYGRFPTCQILDIGAEMFMIDCGEGAQIKMQEYKIKTFRINHVFISHLHGDHYYGLIGWINSQALFGRTEKLHIYCPEKLQQILEIQLEYSLPFEIKYHFSTPEKSEVIFENEKYEAFIFPVLHSVTTHGIRITVKRNKRLLNTEKVRALEIPKYYYNKLCLGFDYERQNGELIKNDEVTMPGKPNLIYAYCADTKYCEAIIPFISHADLLYHEATYCNLNLDKATSRFHSTAEQAASIAFKAHVKQLVIGHYSSKYKDVSHLLTEAKAVFDNTVLAFEGLEIEVK